MSTTWQNHWPDPRRPRRRVALLSEIADALDVSHTALARALAVDARHNKAAPCARLLASHKRKRYYDIAEVRRWWLTRQSDTPPLTP